MTEEKPPKQTKPPKPSSPPPSKRSVNEAPLYLDWLTIGREVETFLGLDEDEANILKGVMQIYPAVRKLIVLPLIKTIQDVSTKT